MVGGRQGCLPWGPCRDSAPRRRFCPLSTQTADDAREFFKRKIDFLTKQMEKIQPALQEKHAMKQGKGRHRRGSALGAVSDPSPTRCLFPQLWWR